MPFTTYHLASGLLIGFFFKKRVDWLTLIVTTTILVDIEPILVFVSLLRNYPVHGYLHTYLASILMGVISGFALYLARGLLSPLNRIFHLSERSHGLISYISGGVLGWFLHVLMDTPLYIDIKPFYPLTVNPLYNPLNVRVLRGLYDIVLICGFITYAIHFYKSIRCESAISLLRMGSLLILGGFIISLHGFNIELRTYSEWLVAVSSILVLMGVYSSLKCLLKLRTISYSRAVLVLVLLAITILTLQVIPRIVLMRIDYLLVAWPLLLLVTLLIRKSLNNFKLKVFRLPVGNMLVVSTALIIVVIGVPLLLLLLLAVTMGGYTYTKL